MDNITFNREIEVDVMFIDGDAVLHIIDRGTKYSVAKFMKNQTAEHTWVLIVELWISTFTSYPDIISADFFQNSCLQLDIATKDTPAESHNSLSLCERYHSIIHRV